MVQKKMVVGDYIDLDTGMRFVEDIRGNLHCMMMPSSQNIDMNLVEELHKRNKRLERILEALRRENNWLWCVLEICVRDGKKNPKQALANLERAIKERTR